LASITAFLGLAAVLSVRLIPAMSHWLTWSTLLPAAAAVAIGLAVADLFSGIVHFLFDQYGSPQTPVIGRKFVTPFRDHHDDPLAMTRGDFIAVNSDNLLICLPVLGLTLALADLRAHPYVGLFVLALVAPVAVTNQIHKWAHMKVVPASVRFAQRHGLILSVDHHDEHHHAPYNRHYCITFGRLDVVLDKVTGQLLDRRRDA
jgi:ubiquitin-conjugating enzyme E2 variant